MHAARLAAAVLAATLCVACAEKGPSKEEIEAAKSTIDCDIAGERILIRFAEGEARLLMPDATRVILYQVTTPAGLRYTNGLFDLRGRGLEFQLTREGASAPLVCKPYEIPKPAEK